MHHGEEKIRQTIFLFYRSVRQLSFIGEEQSVLEELRTIAHVCTHGRYMCRNRRFILLRKNFSLPIGSLRIRQCWKCDRESMYSVLRINIFLSARETEVLCRISKKVISIKSP